MWFQSLTQSSSICLCWRLLAASEDVSGGLEGGESSRWPQRFCSEEVLHLSYGSCLVYKTSPACPACLLLQGEAAVGVQLGYLENRMLSWSPGSLKKCWMDGREDFKTLFGDFDLQTLDFNLVGVVVVLGLQLPELGVSLFGLLIIILILRLLFFVVFALHFWASDGLLGMGVPSDASRLRNGLSAGEGADSASGSIASSATGGLLYANSFGNSTSRNLN
eukprot:CAMPEP_0206586128 /NCGR_PEP_ID=MMETSP0325_2-20121206/36830_1 /ASSEMBLY_ACC=CAM_ASM_000347 /TAXON_ID=2866 /ORGANISM="Crypthecodinium cohnii, Strain Seligo" /LENGTH=219 /DNA_ID=CAMNT_0054093811 /DNA_START=271 /DNA_END=928 /DNA_ORIENTATION=-